MRMTDRTIELDCGKLTPTFSQRLAAGLTPLTSFFRVFRNRMEINGLNDLNDTQLRDIGLTRTDLTSAFLASTFFEDPSEHLTRSARNRWRLSLFRSHEE
ncbi:DUF1127 domain-containing protein [Rhizobium leguminosarum]|jgi:uncharacterized protein YjiS (DUF1127 family)|uniref:DUF1127 domain-containing protein n=1 Tax=Rhizobium leguminosarum TaxID=384 RepID=A0A2Z4YIW7_RHILE|nr:DUF1127 domain-containing protein [Rhizobium leguminosarum]ASS54306.1 DUF1127 domain-containing protein [Rhizobium leguminosarum bv. viciae]AVC48398.1 hypothetical protein RLV_3233 [Rhizobium leguminosarum bv. viciae]AXA41400.1 hypothetical protein DLJ82_3835 [Rhizobium leguminosarum]MBY5470986.1 DUF1127 domain-containing protein [Rhizobium leguminosarum]MBY5477661.1 DUF1127 domain-containing protein [Rhizobium leguminosarum]